MENENELYKIEYFGIKAVLKVPMNDKHKEDTEDKMVIL